jgi:regulator of protease activity HflC (stomatin/prohibitin superfamily)
MNTLVWVFAVVLTIVGATVGSVKRVDQGNEALVQRLGRYHRKLTPGLNFGVIPIIDEVVIEANTRERTLDIEPSDMITSDSVTVKVDAVIFWRIIDLYSAFYEIDNVSEALKNLVITTLRSEIGEMGLQQTYSSREEINKALLENLDEATEPWGVKVTRVEIQDIQIPQTIRESLESERASLSKKRAAIAEAEGAREAAIAEAEGERQAAIKQAEAISESIKRIADAMPAEANPQDILRYLVMQRYVDANMKLSASENSKVIFMNPRDITENIDALLRDRLVQYTPPTPNPDTGNEPQA